MLLADGTVLSSAGFGSAWMYADRDTQAGARVAAITASQPGSVRVLSAVQVSGRRAYGRACEGQCRGFCRMSGGLSLRGRRCFSGSRKG